MPSGSVAVLVKGQIPSACARHHVPLLEKLPGDTKQCQDLRWREERRGDPQQRGSQAGFLLEDAPVQGGQWEEEEHWTWEGTQEPVHLTR